MRTTRIVAVLVAALLLVQVGAVAASAARPDHAGSPIEEDAIWADGRLFGTIALGALPFNSNPHAFNLLFTFPGGEQQAVAEAAPGRGYKGGRWIPVAVTWNVEPFLLTSAEQVAGAAAAGAISLGDPQYEAAFLCPLIPRR